MTVELGHLLYGPFASKKADILLELTIPGDPLSKQRPRWNKKTGITYTPSETRHREEGIANLARVARTELTVDPFSLFSLRAGFHLKGNQRRDVDNMLKLICDALTGVIWEDDSQVVEVFGFKVPADQPEQARAEIAVLRMPGTMPYTLSQCLICQRPFRIYPSRQRYKHCCSRRCYGLSIRNRVAVTCRGCQKVFEIPMHKNGAIHHYCSRACRFRQVEKICGGCGKVFSVEESVAHKRKNCSRGCYTPKGRPKQAINRAALGVTIDAEIL